MSDLTSLDASLRGFGLFAFVCAVLLASPMQAQEAPLSPGQFDSLLGLRLQSPDNVFRPDGTTQSLDDALVLDGASFRAISLEAQISYALNQRILFSLRGPVLRFASLTGESFLLPDITLERSEQVLGPGDLALSVAFMPRPNPRAQWGATLSVRAPLGSDSARLPMGSGVFGGQVGLFGYQSQEPYFVRASLAVGNEDSYSLGAFSAVGAGVFWRRYSLSQELRGVLPLADIPDASVGAREALTGVSPRSSSLSSVSTLSASFGNITPLVSMQWLFAGQNEAKGLAYFVGLRVAPQRQGDHSRGVP